MTYLEIEPARAKRVSDKKLETLWSSHEWIAEEKLDGWRYLMHFGGRCDRVYLTGRRISEKTGMLSEKGLQVPQIWPVYENGMQYTVLDGEIFPPEGASFRDIAGIMNAEVEVAQATIARIGPPTFRAFDILFTEGADCRELAQMQRRRILEVAVDKLDHPLIRIIPQIKQPTREHFDAVVERGGEGLILKDLGAEYGEGWVKVKREHTLDVVVTGFTEARFGRTGRIFGQVGALVVSVYANDRLVEVAQVSGMDDATRLEITNNKNEWLGRVVEITAQEWAKDRLRHPRYVRARFEAEPRSCTFTKMMRDLGRAEEPCRDEKQLTLL